MDKKNDIIDYGEVKVPSGWDELTLKKFQEIERYYSDKEKSFNILDVLDILIDKDRDYIMSLPEEFLDKILDKLQFLQTKPDVGEPSNKIKWKGDTYTIHTENKLKVGEYVAVDTLIKGDPHNYAGVLAILARKENEEYDSKYENEILEDRMKMWESVPVKKVMKTINFFLSLWVVLEIPTQLYSRTMEGINLTAKNIETSVKNGEVSKRYGKSLMRKLRKLEKSLGNI